MKYFIYELKAVVGYNELWEGLGPYSQKSLKSQVSSPVPSADQSERREQTTEQITEQ